MPPWTLAGPPDRQSILPQTVSLEDTTTLPPGTQRSFWQESVLINMDGTQERVNAITTVSAAGSWRKAEAAAAAAGPNAIVFNKQKTTAA